MVSSMRGDCSGWHGRGPGNTTQERQDVGSSCVRQSEGWHHAATGFFRALANVTARSDFSSRLPPDALGEPAPLLCPFWCAGVAWARVVHHRAEVNNFWSLSGNFIYRHHVEPRVKLYSPREESYPIPVKYIDVTRNTHTSLGENIDAYWNVDGDRELSDAWTGFTRFILLNERPLDGYTWSEGETDEETNNLKTRQMHGQICGSICLMQRKAKQSKSELSKNESSIMPDNFVVSSSLTQKMKNSNTP